MQKIVEQDMGWSSALFREQVWPMLQKKIGGELMQMEGRPDTELAKMLDMRAGIDGWHVHDLGIRGIASRIQQGRAWNTFTVRMARDSGSSTEFEKRKQAISDGRGWIYPHLTVQAYAETKSGPVLSVGVCETRSLIGFIEHGHHVLRRTSNALFAVCDWVRMANVGVKVMVLNKTEA